MYVETISSLSILLTFLQLLSNHFVRKLSMSSKHILRMALLVSSTSQLGSVKLSSKPSKLPLTLLPSVLLSPRLISSCEVNCTRTLFDGPSATAIGLVCCWPVVSEYHSSLWGSSSSYSSHSVTLVEAGVLLGRSV
jgi:hypothetical protein